jgi:hypothetical protein
MRHLREQTLQDIKFLLCVLIALVVLGLFMLSLR